MNSKMIRQLITLFFSCLFSCFCSLAFAQAESESSQFLRFVAGSEQWQGELQSAITSYRNAAGVSVDLVSAIHIADDEYYAELNEYFLSRDAVLYELVAEPDNRPSTQIEDQRVSVLGFMQQMLARFLDLSFQLERIDYHVENFVHADMTPSQLAVTMEAKDENFMSMFLSLAAVQLANEQAAAAKGESTPAISALSLISALMANDRATALKSLLAAELARSNGLLISPELENQLTILGDRNRVVVEVLQRQLSDVPQGSAARFSIFFGAAHMPGIERELLNSMGFLKQGQTWLTAWDIP